MRSPRCVLVLGVALGSGCTQDFDSFSVVESDAAAGRAAAAGRPDGSSADGQAGRPDGSAARGQAGAPDGQAAGGAGASGAGAAGVDSSAPCPAGQKRCGAACVSTSSPEYGCAGPSCTPCAANHATSGCGPTGICTMTGCEPNFGNCNAQPGDGCEADVASDPLNCGACGRACSQSNVASAQCSGGRCTSTCNLGSANCSQPAAPSADDGCELDVRENSTNCGGCGNSCTAQNDMVCGLGGSLDNFCGCAGSDSRCQTGTGGGNCLSSGSCQCQTSSGSVTCRPGEVCVRVGSFPNHACRCNGVVACTPGQVCCQTPSGCVSIQTDVTSCGACGRACPPGFSCSAGRCACSGAASCSAGTSGTCNTEGRCVCGATTCDDGERCLPTGACG